MIHGSPSVHRNVFVVLFTMFSSVSVLAQAELKGATPSSEALGGSIDGQAEGAGTPAVVIDDNHVKGLLGMDVSGTSGEQLGRVVDLLVSNDGAINAAVIDFGGFLGVGTRKVAVAWATLKFSDNRVVVGMTKDELRVTPEYRAGEPVVIVGRTGAKSGQVLPDEPAAKE